MKLQNFSLFNLYIILDAARFDVFKSSIKKFNIHGSLEKRQSLGRYTLEFYNNLYEPDINIYTANPTPFLVKNKHFGNITLTRNINPVDNIREFLENREKNKRYILHLIPPHVPWQGKEGKIAYQKFMKEKNWSDNANAIGRGRHFGPMNIEQHLFQYYGRDKALYYYQENMEVGLNAIESFLNKIPKPFVITADHGNLFGECGYWGHTIVNDCNILREVPWYIVR